MRKALAMLAAGLLLMSCRAKERPPDVAQLVRELCGNDARKSGEARLQLIGLGEPAVPALSDLLRSGQPAERLAAANTLWGLGARGRSAVPDLAAALGEDDAALRVAVAMALESMGPAAAPAVPALVKAIGDRDGSVRQAAVKALAAIGPAARDALPALTRALKRSSWPEADEAVRRIRGLPANAPVDLSGGGADER
jgi:HEAT repeat protein